MEKDRFNAFYHTHKVSVFQIAYAYLRNIEESEDAVLESFLRLFRLKKTFRTEKDQKYYLIRITINVCKDILKKNKPVYSDDLVIAKTDTYNTGNRLLWEKVEKLASMYREVIILKYIEEYEYDEIAKILNTSSATIRKRHERAVKELRKLYEEEA